MKIYCGGADCGDFVGEIGPSVLEAKRGQLVWRIQPGWTWRDGVLQQDDYTYEQERRLLHEMTGRQRLVQGLALGRECDLPVRVRCPKCHRVKWITADLVFRRVS